MGVSNSYTFHQRKAIAENVLDKLSDDLYDADVNLIAQARLLAEEELEQLGIEWSDREINEILDEIEINDLEEHRKEVFLVNRIGIYASLGLSQSDFI